MGVAYCLYKVGLPSQFLLATFFKSWAGWQNEKNSIPAKSRSSRARGNFENCTHNIKADTVSPHNIFIMTYVIDFYHVII